MITILIASYAAAGVLSVALLDYGKNYRPLTRAAQLSSQTATPWFRSSFALPR